MDSLTHEKLYRTEEIIRQRSESSLLILGIGALGSNLVPLLIKNGFINICVLDNDRVDSHNIGNQFFTKTDVGRKKTQALKSKIHKEFGVLIDTVDQDVEHVSPKSFKKKSLIVDTFDNWKAREISKNISKSTGIELIHSGMSPEGYSEVKWDEGYVIPSEEIEEEDICEYPLACNLVYFTVSLLADKICKFIDTGEKENCSFTLNDLNISRF